MKKIGSFLAIVVLTMATLAVPAYALVRSDDTVIVQADEVIEDDFFASGDQVTIEGTIKGDVYVGASRLTVRGTVHGDVIAGAQTIEITGAIRDDLRVAGNNISLVGAEIGDSVSVAGNELSIDRDSTVGGALLFGGRLLTLDGSIGRGVTSGSETTRIDGLIGSTSRIAATDITIDRDAIIQGNLEYRSDNDAVINGTITGEVTKTGGGGLNFSTEGIARWFIVGYTTWAYIGAAIIGVLLMLLMPQLFKRSQQNLAKKPWRTVGIGAVATLATIPAVIVLALTIFGIPLAIVTLVLWLLGIYFTKFFVGYAVGTLFVNWMTKKPWGDSSHKYLALLLGLLFYYILRLIPGLGFFVSFATTLVGFGLMLSLYRTKSSEHKKQKYSPSNTK